MVKFSYRKVVSQTELAESGHRSGNGNRRPTSNDVIFERGCPGYDAGPAGKNSGASGNILGPPCAAMVDAGMMGDYPTLICGPRASLNVSLCRSHA